MAHANTTFEIKSWDEKTYDEFDGRKLTRARVIKVFRGDIEGESIVEYLMSYAADGSAGFVGMERIIGKLAGRAGSFVLQHSGTFQGGVASANWFVVAGSGTGALHGLKGRGKSAIGHAEQYAMPLEYEFEDSQSETRDDM